MQIGHIYFHVVQTFLHCYQIFTDHLYQFTAMDTKKNMTDEERQLLAEKLDNDLEKFIEEKKEEAKNSPTLEDDIGADELAEVGMVKLESTF